jgi:hypothetical protein
MAYIKTKEVTIQDLINYLSQFPKDAIVCTHNSHAWFHNKVKPINESDMSYFIQKVENPINDCGESLKQVFVSIHNYRQADY